MTPEDRWNGITAHARREPRAPLRALYWPALEMVTAPALAGLDTAQAERDRGDAWLMLKRMHAVRKAARADAEAAEIAARRARTETPA